MSTEAFVGGEAKQTVTVTGSGQVFPTLALSVIAGEKAETVTASSAELQATVNPEGLQVSRCEFEYGMTTSYGQIARCAQKKSAIGAGTQPVPVSAQLTELSPNTTYHWRLNVKDTDGEAHSPDHTFVYPTTGGEQLPDGRAYEMITPPFKDGGLVGDVFTGGVPSISESGSRVIAMSISCFAGAESCDGARQGNGEPFEFTRSDDPEQCKPAAPPCWGTTPLAPPATEYSQNTPWLFDANEGTALFSMLTGGKGEDEWYARASGSFSAIGPATPPGITGIAGFQTSVITTTANLSHVIWRENNGLFWPFDKAVGHASLYEYAGTHTGAHNQVPFLVGVTGGSGSSELISDCETGLGLVNGEVPWDALSGDGRTAYFTAGSKNGGCPEAKATTPVSELYVRIDGEGPEAHTVAISQPDSPEIAGESSRGYPSPPDENCTSDECRKISMKK